MKTILLLWIFITFSLIGKANPIDSILVEYGGGMTGQITEYKIVQCTVFKSNYRLVKIAPSQSAKVCSKQLKNIYKASKRLLEKIEGFEKPGNMYKSVVLFSGGNKVIYKWGDSSFEPPIEIKDLYDQILNLAKELKFQ